MINSPEKTTKLNDKPHDASTIHTSPPGIKRNPPRQPERPGLHYTQEGDNLSQEEGHGGGGTSETERVADGAGSTGEEGRGSRGGGGSRAAVSVSIYSMYRLRIGNRKLT